MKKSYFISKILDILNDSAMMSGEIFSIFFTDYYTSYKRARRVITGYVPKEVDISNENNKKKELYLTKDQFYVILSKLKKEGFIEQKSKEGRSTIWQITKKGKEKLNDYKKSKSKFDIDPCSYNKQKENSLKIIIFDIPETERNKRNLLRSILKNLDYKMLQKSVWVGYNKIPEDLIRDLMKYNILPYLHIFEVSKKGTIEKINKN